MAGSMPVNPRRRRFSQEQRLLAICIQVDGVFDSVLLAEMSTLFFRMWARRFFGSGHAHADHPGRAYRCRRIDSRPSGAKKEMAVVDKADDARKLGRHGASVASVARDTGVSEPTVRRYLREAIHNTAPRSAGRFGPVAARRGENPVAPPGGRLVGGAAQLGADPGRHVPAHGADEAGLGLA